MEEAPAPARTGRLDLPGAALAATGFGLLTYGLVEGADRGFGRRLVDVRRGRRRARRVRRRRDCGWRSRCCPFALFRERNFAVANAQTFLVYAGLYGFFVFFTLYLQFLGFTPFEAGLLNIPSSIVLIFLAARFGALSDKHGPRLFLTVGPALIGLGTLVFIVVDTSADFWTYGIVGILLFSLGLAMMVAPITATALKSAPERYAGIASGVNSTVSRLGSLIAVAVIGLVISLVFDANTDAPDAVPLAKDQTAPDLRAPRWTGSARGCSSPPPSRSPAPRSGRSESRTARRAARSRPRSANRQRRQPKAEPRGALAQRATASSRVSPKPVKIASR